MSDKITIIELFSGIGAQERAMRQLGISYEIINTCDCDSNAVLSYVAMRTNFENEFENYIFPSQDKMIEELQAKNIGYDFDKGKHSITSRTPITKLKQYYLADKLSNNLGDISKVERLPYADLVTYSSPCQSFSVAGKLAGAAKTCQVCGHQWDIDFSNPDYNYQCPHCGNTNLESTTSGLLQEVQRLLSVAYENNELPKYLLLENVKNLVGKKFIGQFTAWIKWLDSIGYNTYYQVLNAKHYGIPQNRERVFAISIRKDIDDNRFNFPEPIPLTIRLKDILEGDVDEKYYLPDDRIEKILNSTFMQEKKRIQTTDVCDTLLARDWKDPKCVSVEDNIKIVGNYMPSNHDASRVVDIDGIAPTVKENHGTVTAIAEPFCVASRGRNPNNPSDRTTGAPTEQRLEPNFSGCTNTITSVQKDNYIAEPQVLRAERTEYGKSIRKEYESGKVYEKIGNMRELTPREDGVSNTITTVQKDNYVIEPLIIQKFGDRGTDQYSVRNYVHTIPANPMSDRGQMIVEPTICEERKDEGLRFFKDDCVGTLRTIDACGDKRVIEPKQNTNPIRLGNIYGEQYGTGYAGNVWDKDAISPSLMTMQGGNRQPMIIDDIKWRIRKLTPKECWRLMGFTDQDFNRAAQFISNSSFYKQAGNSICTCCLIAIFNTLFNHNSNYEQYLIHYDD